MLMWKHKINLRYFGFQLVKVTFFIFQMAGPSHSEFATTTAVFAAHFIMGTPSSWVIIASYEGMGNFNILYSLPGIRTYTLRLGR